MLSVLADELKAIRAREIAINEVIMRDLIMLSKLICKWFALEDGREGEREEYVSLGSKCMRLKSCTSLRESAFGQHCMPS